VGHVDHGIRGKESAADARFVKALAKALGLAHAAKKAGLKAGTSEGAAREARLAALAAIVKARRCVGVVMAHHADDQAETVLMRMMRGCGLKGLSGMAGEAEIAGMAVYRPLLNVRRRALREYLERVGQTWREDASNARGDYLRNRVRLELMPVVERIWPAGVGALARLAEVAAEAQDVIAGQFELMADAVPAVGDGTLMTMPREDLRRVYPAVLAEFLRVVVEGSGGTRELADFERIREAVRVIHGNAGGKCVEMGRGVEVHVSGKWVMIAGMGNASQAAKRARRSGAKHAAPLGPGHRTQRGRRGGRRDGR